MPKKSPESDVCLVLEGTYPYVAGGVSTWVHQIITAFPDLKFSIFYIGAEKTADQKSKYSVPANVVETTEVYLFDSGTSSSRVRNSLPASWSKFHETLGKFHVRLPAGDPHDFEIVKSLIEHVAQNTAVSFETFWQDANTWDILRRLYQHHTPQDSFLDFYWTCCFLIHPIWKLARGIGRMPKAKLYHTACTGYAGLAASIGAARNQAPLLLSEHGIYLRERIGDICRSQWIPEKQRQHPTLAQPLGSLRQLWIGFFDLLGRLCYQRSDTVVALFEKNAVAQRHFGADPSRMVIIPNGIRTEECESWHQQRLERRRANAGSQVIGFLGRVVSIKDIKTLLQTARRVCDALPEARFLIAGPTEEEPEYFQECLELSAQLNLQHHIDFMGPVERANFLPKLDIMILTSVSEGLPFVVIESLSAGVPVVSTDVGACAEILIGRPADTPAIGACGLIADVGSADELASACVRLLTDSMLLDDMTANGRVLATRHYHERDALGAYRSLYEKLMSPKASLPTPHP